jgi:hypothetical protein
VVKRIRLTCVAGCACITFSEHVSVVPTGRRPMLPSNCPSCQQERRRLARFCPRCGRRCGRRTRTFVWLGVVVCIAVASVTVYRVRRGSADTQAMPTPSVPWQADPVVAPTTPQQFAAEQHLPTLEQQSTRPDEESPRQSPVGADRAGAATLPALAAVDPADPSRRVASVVYVCDASGSMLNLLPMLKVELRSAIDSLSPDQSFNVVFFLDPDRTPRSLSNTLLAATPPHKNDCYLFLHGWSREGVATPFRACASRFRSIRN